MFLENKNNLEMEMAQASAQGLQGRGSLRSLEVVAGDFGELRLLEGISERRDAHKQLHREDGFSVVKVLRGRSSSFTERSPLLRFSQDDSLTYMTLHDPGLVGGGLDLEKGGRLGGEVSGLSLTGSGSSDKTDPPDLSLKPRLSSSIKCCFRGSRVAVMFAAVVLCSSPPEPLEPSRTLQTPPEPLEPSRTLRTLQTPPEPLEPSRALKNPPDPSRTLRTLQNPPEPARTLQNPPEPSRTLQNP
ncbi:hypothetical protein EYF80_057295 [Liparis tanakae]|uniref:Uncharacterized protein n=1 Tax=Liparis tanakae TaxID=230148 RepID=A0A4Z2EW07_9TELE|nr:hypothetical protein EYF80_057295 [Liparis tanakae]